MVLGDLLAASAECGATVQCDWPVLVFINLIVFPPAAGRVLRKWFVNGIM